jgi:hypothetical protein
VAVCGVVWEVGPVQPTHLTFTHISTHIGSQTAFKLHGVQSTYHLHPTLLSHIVDLALQTYMEAFRTW